jgi:hypothetical protein
VFNKRTLSKTLLQEKTKGYSYCGEINFDRLTPFVQLLFCEEPHAQLLLIFCCHLAQRETETETSRPTPAVPVDVRMIFTYLPENLVFEIRESKKGASPS